MFRSPATNDILGQLLEAQDRRVHDLAADGSAHQSATTNDAAARAAPSETSYSARGVTDNETTKHG
jgi:hypothetical protein